MILTLVLLAQVTAATPATPAPLKVVVLTDGSRYDLAKPYEIRGSQARLQLVNGPLVSVPVAQIDVAASQRAAAPPPPPPPPPPVAPPAHAAARMVIGPDDIRPAPTPEPEPFVPGMKPAPEKVAPPRPDYEKAAADAAHELSEMEGLWIGKSRDRRDRLAAAQEKQREVCARANAAAQAAVTKDGYMSTAAAAVVAALRADCQAEMDRVYRIEVVEKARLQESCRKTPGCAPGWVRD